MAPVTAGRLVFFVLLALLTGCSAGTDGTAHEDRPGVAAPKGFEHRTAEANGVRLRYVIGGKGPAGVLLHGFPETWYAWRGPTLCTPTSSPLISLSCLPSS